MIYYIITICYTIIHIYIYILLSLYIIIIYWLFSYDYIHIIYQIIIIWLVRRRLFSIINSDGRVALCVCSLSLYIYICIYVYIYIYIYIYSCIYLQAANFCSSLLWTPNRIHPLTVSFHNFKSRIFKLSVSNPKNKYVAYVSVLSQISNFQGLGRKNKF